MHKVRLSQTNAGIEIERVVNFTRRFRHCEGGCMRELVIAADDEGFKCVLRIQVCIFHDTGEGIFLFFNDRILLVRSYIVDIQCETGDLGNRDLDRERILFVENIDAHDAGGDNEGDADIVHTSNFKRLKPGSEGYIGQFVIIFNFVQDFRPVFFDQRIVVHFYTSKRKSSRSTFLFARLRSAGGVYLSGGLKPATETSRILIYPPLIEAGIFPTEIKAFFVYLRRFYSVLCKRTI